MNKNSLIPNLSSKMTRIFELTAKKNILNNIYTKNVQFILKWLSLYILFIILFNMSNFLLTRPIYIPTSFSDYINSSWGGLLMISFILSMILHLFFITNLNFDDLVTINNSIASIQDSNTKLAVFTCIPPILHDKNDFSFFIENFQPFSIEFYPNEKKICLILYGNHEETFESKMKECLNQLQSFFSHVYQLNSEQLRQFLISGYRVYLLNSIVSSKLSFNSNQKAADFLLNQFHHTKKFSDIDMLMNTKSNQDNGLNLVFSTMLMGRNGSNVINNSFTGHLFRGIRIGYNQEIIEKSQFSIPAINTKNLSRVLLSTLRIPDISLEDNSVMDFHKIYFMIIHKFFNYYFNDIKENTENLLINRSLISPTVPSHSDEASENNNFTQSELSKCGSTEQITPLINLNQNNHQKIPKIKPKSNDLDQPSLKNVKTKISGSLADLKKVSFQFTHFCQLFCPNINEEFRKKSISLKNEFSIPDKCFKHISAGNSNLYEFLMVDNNQLSSTQVFHNEEIQEKFIDFIREKNLSLIDKICHFTSLLVLSKNPYLIDENTIFSLLQNVGETYFTQ